MSLRLRTLTVLIIGIAGGASFSLGYAAWAAHDTRVASIVPWRDAQLFAEVYERVKHDYVDEVPDEKLMEAAVRGAVASLDPYSEYLDADEFEEMRVSTSGEYSGVGVEISVNDGALKVVAAIDDSPAAHAGIRSGDTITAVDKIPVDPSDVNESINRLRGKPGSKVKLSIARDAVEPFDVVLTRGSVQVHSVKQEMLEPGYAYIRISQFNENTGVDFAHTLTALQSQKPLSGLVLDLRNNPGGVLDAAVVVADSLLDHGTIVTADGRTPDAKFAMQAHSGDITHNAGIVVLVNNGSASASEIVAGALKDNSRAILMGQTTFGKGVVQSVVPLSSGGAVKLTTSRYYTPSGASIQDHGIVPDVVVGDLAKDAPPVPKRGAALLIEDGEVRLALDHLKKKGKT